MQYAQEQRNQFEGFLLAKPTRVQEGGMEWLIKGHSFSFSGNENVLELDVGKINANELYTING